MAFSTVNPQVVGDFSRLWSVVEALERLKTGFNFFSRFNRYLRGSHLGRPSWNRVWPCGDFDIAPKISVTWGDYLPSTPWFLL